MKIACIISKIRLSGGAERVMCELCNGLVERGHEVYLITQEEQKGETYYLSERVNKLNTAIKINIRGVRGILRNRKLHNLLRMHKFDVAVSFMTETNILAIIASIGTGVPVVVSERVDPKVFCGMTVGRFRSMFYPLATGFVFQTDEAQQFFSEKIQEASVVIPNPIVDGLPEKVDYTQTHNIVAVGRLSAQKNYPLMLRTFATFVKTHPDYILEIFGAGALQESLSQLAADLGCKDSVCFMGLRDDVHKYVKDADLFLMTSDFEGMSNALAEAMAIGLPVVSTDCSGGGASYLIKHGENGYLAECGNEEELLSYLTLMAENDDLRKSVGEKAKEIIKRLDRKVVFDQWESFLEKVVSSSNN